MGTMAITAISVRFPTINGRVTRARGQVRGQDTKAVVRRKRSGYVTVVMQPISRLVHFVRSAEKVGGIGKKRRTRKNENEAEQGWTEAVRPKWKANAVATSCCMEVENTEEKVQQYVADVNTGNSKREVSGWQRKWKWEEMKKEWI